MNKKILITLICMIMVVSIALTACFSAPENNKSEEKLFEETLKEIGDVAWQG